MCLKIKDDRRDSMKITGDMTIGEVVRSHPEAARVLMSFGMGCIS